VKCRQSFALIPHPSSLIPHPSSLTLAVAARVPFPSRPVRIPV
jgi:hypothetical protein